MARVTILGLDAIGSAIAQRLHNRAIDTVVVYDHRSHRRAWARRANLSTVDDPRPELARAEVVVVSGEPFALSATLASIIDSVAPRVPIMAVTRDWQHPVRVATVSAAYRPNVPVILATAMTDGMVDPRTTDGTVDLAAVPWIVGRPTDPKDALAIVGALVAHLDAPAVIGAFSPLEHDARRALFHDAAMVLRAMAMTSLARHREGRGEEVRAGDGPMELGALCAPLLGPEVGDGARWTHVIAPVALHLTAIMRALRRNLEIVEFAQGRPDELVGFALATRRCVAQAIEPQPTRTPVALAPSSVSRSYIELLGAATLLVIPEFAPATGDVRPATLTLASPAFRALISHADNAARRLQMPIEGHDTTVMREALRLMIVDLTRVERMLFELCRAHGPMILGSDGMRTPMLRPLWRVETFFSEAIAALPHIPVSASASASAHEGLQR